jgi:hypothetical protein
MDGPLGCSGHEVGAELPLLVLNAVRGSLNTSKYVIQTKIVRKTVICALYPPKFKRKILENANIGKLFLITYGSQSNIYFYIQKQPEPRERTVSVYSMRELSWNFQTFYGG